MAATLTVLAAALASSAIAGSFRVNPVNIAIAPNKATGELSLTNMDAEPVAVRVTALKWTQRDGVDVYEETRDVIASPPIFTIPPRGKQLVRLGLRTRTPGAAYRVIAEEIPGPSNGRTGIRVALRLNLPLYVLVPGGTAALSWTAWRNEAGHLVVQAHNSGAAPGTVLNIAAQDASGTPIGATSAAGIVLPASARRWTLGKGDGIPAILVVRGAKGETRSQVLVGRP